MIDEVEIVATGIRVTFEDEHFGNVIVTRCFEWCTSLTDVVASCPGHRSRRREPVISSPQPNPFSGEAHYLPPWHLEGPRWVSLKGRVRSCPAAHSAARVARG